MNKSKRYGAVLSLITFAVLFAAGVCLGMIGLYFSTGIHKLPLFGFYFTQPKIVWLNIWPYLLICMIVWFATDRAWIGFLFGGVFCLVYSFAEYWKLASRDDPILAEDVTLLKEALQMSGEYVSVTWQMKLAVFLVILGTVIFFFFFRGKMPHFSLRIIMPTAVVVLCGLLYGTVYTSSSLYNSFAVWDQVNPWFDNSIYISRGGIYPFIYSIQNAVPKEPEGYGESEAVELLTSYENDMIPEDKQVSVVCVMYEAFVDFSKYTDMITGIDPYESYHKLQTESYHGELVTNIFAGGTINTERCVLTGYSELTNFRRTGWSYARYFSDMGYTVDGSHAGYEAFYNRRNVNRNLGIDNYRFIENYFSSIVSGIPWDNVFMPEITRLSLEQIENGEKLFSFNVTYQNHGPYADDKLYTGGREFVPKGELDDSDYHIINNYLSGVSGTSGRMLEMADVFRDIEQPVVLVFFGDHKPWLGDSGKTYSALGIDLLSGSDETFYNYYNTDYIIWANNAAKLVLDNDFIGTGPTISPCYLMNVLFEQCGWDGPSYMKLTDKVMSAMPVVSTNDRYLEDGSLVSEIELSDENKTLLSEMRKAQFYLAQDASGELPG